MSGLRAGQSMTSTSCLSRAVWGGAFSWTYTKLRLKFCVCILETPLASWLLLAENCHLPTTWQFTALFALANFVAWSPLKVQRNVNNLCRNATLHKSIKVVMARQTSLQVTTPELTFFLLLSLSSPQTILTVFGHSIWLRNGSMKSTVFRFAIEHTTINNKYR